MIIEIHGRIIVKRSEADPEYKCACCKGGKHIHSIAIEVPEEKSKVFPGILNREYKDYIYEFLSKNKEDIEGKEVKITVEIID